MIDLLILPVLGVNCYILHDEREAIIIDAGSGVDKIIKFIDDKNLKVKYLLNTHGHFDHAGAVAQLTEYTKSPFYMHKSDLDVLKSGVENATYFGLDFIIPKVDKYFEDNDVIDFNGLKIRVIHTPGHTPGSVCFYIENDKTLLSGDTLFLQSVGRVDFPYSNPHAIEISIRDKLYKLNDDVKVLPGHGGSTSIGYEKKNNPFITE